MRLKPIFITLALATAIAADAQKNGNNNWPAFRGEHAAGIAANQSLPETFDGEKGAGIKWKARIPGLAHSSPIVWGDRVFVTTAVSSKGQASFKRGLYGDGDASDDRSVHQWKVYCLDKKSGKILWEQVAYEGEPKEKRHIKSTYASSTPVTDGRYVVAFFGSQGVYAYDMKGKLAWKRDLGRMNVGAYNDASYEWGTASSPTIYKDFVILQVDTSEKEDYLIALNLKTGETAWKTPREELPSWGTPTIYPGPSAAGATGKEKPRTELITNASNFIKGYDPLTGKELWRLGGSSQITAPTPIFDGDLILVASGRRPEAPIFVIRGGASGDITLPADKTSSQHIAWTRQRAGSYMPTPLIYNGLVYVLRNQGILSCYDLKTGEMKYEERIPHQGSGFSGSPVAADGRIYLPSEDGDIFIVRAGDKFELLGKGSVGQALMATPAISGGLMFVRAEKDLFAIGR